MVVIDSTNLLLMLRPRTPVPGGVDRAKERIDYLVQRLSKEKAKIIIPTPALSEALVKAGAAASLQIVEEIQKHAVFSIEPFDTRAALEASAMSRAAIAGGSKKGSSTAPWQKVKFDRQIVAIAKVHGASEIYSDDGDIAALGQQAKIKVITLSDLPLPPQRDQLDFLLDAAAPAEPASGDEG